MFVSPFHYRSIPLVINSPVPVDQIKFLIPKWCNPGDPGLAAQLALVRAMLPGKVAIGSAGEYFPTHVQEALGWIEKKRKSE